MQYVVDGTSKTGATQPLSSLVLYKHAGPWHRSKHCPLYPAGCRLHERVPTVSFTWEGRHPRDIAAALGEQGIYVWDGNYYALAVTERLRNVSSIVRQI